MGCETKLITQLSSSKERCRELEGRTEDLEQRGQQQQDAIYELKEGLTAAQAQAKMAATRTEGQFLEATKASIVWNSFRI